LKSGKGRNRARPPAPVVGFGRPAPARTRRGRPPKHQLSLDLTGLHLGRLETDDDFRRAARKLLPAALEELGQAMGDAAWAWHHRANPAVAAGHGKAGPDMRAFVAKAGRTYRRFAPVGDRQALEDLLCEKLRAAKAGAPTRHGGDTAPG
jgi:hypothetical protein